MSDYHIPVLLQECVEALRVLPDGQYVDATFGAGGHSLPILKKLNAKGRLFGFDKDGDAKDNIPDNDGFTFVNADYRYIANFMRYYNVNGLDGILADLGISSHQIDVPERGFSFRYDAVLDMRMNTNQKWMAKDIIHSYSESDLVRVLSEYGEVRNAKTLAAALVKVRNHKAILTTFDLNQVLLQCLMGQPQAKYFAQVYQALRIEVNDELNALKQFLTDGTRCLKSGGRFVIITYHSLEDRLVKNLFKTGNTDGKMDKDEFGNIHKPFELLFKDVLLPGEQELKSNPRSRSAKLRVGIKK